MKYTLNHHVQNAQVIIALLSKVSSWNMIQKHFQDVQLRQLRNINLTVSNGPRRRNRSNNSSNIANKRSTDTQRIVRTILHAEIYQSHIHIWLKSVCNLDPAVRPYSSARSSASINDQYVVWRDDVSLEL
jgi:hypothetical protein